MEKRYKCDNCNKPCNTIYYDKERGMKLCEKCEFEDESLSDEEL